MKLKFNLRLPCVCLIQSIYQIQGLVKLLSIYHFLLVQCVNLLLLKCPEICPLFLICRICGCKYEVNHHLLPKWNHICLISKPASLLISRYLKINGVFCNVKLCHVTSTHIPFDCYMIFISK